MRLQQVDVGVHAASGRRAKGAGRVAIGRFRRARVVDRVVFDVLRQRLTAVDELFQLRVGDIAGHDNRPAQRQAGRHRVLRQQRQNIAHRLVEVDLDRLTLAGLTKMLGNIFARIALQFLNPDPLTVDLGFDIAIRRAGDPHAHRARGAVARQADDADIVGEVFAAELRAETKVLRLHQQFLFQLNIAEGLTVFVAFGRQAVVVLG